MIWKLMKANRRILMLPLGLSLLFGVSVSKAAIAHDWLGECTVNFDNPFALEHLASQARSTFAFPTGLSAAGKPEPCDTSAHEACWTYRHRCAQNYVNVDDMSYGHFHLSFEDPTLSDPAALCFADPGDGGGSGFGRKSGSECVPANWGAEPRILQSHVQDHWVKVWLEDRVTHVPKVFDMSEIYVGGDVPIQLWFKRTDGTWHCWKELGPGTRWKLKQWAHDLVEVRIRGASGGAGPYTIRSFKIQD